jgi:hypothetical protein
VVGAGHGHFTAPLPDDGSDFLGVRGDDDAVCGTRFDDTLPDADNQGSAAKESKGFAREPRGTEPGGYDRERAQATSFGGVRRCKRHAIQGIPVPIEIQAGLIARNRGQTALRL